MSGHGSQRSGGGDHQAHQYQGPGRPGNNGQATGTGTTAFAQQFQRQAQLQSQTNGSRNTGSPHRPSPLGQGQRNRGGNHPTGPASTLTPGAWTGPNSGRRGQAQRPQQVQRNVNGNNVQIHNTVGLGTLAAQPLSFEQRRNQTVQNQAAQQQAPPNRPIAQPRGPKLTRRQRRAILNHRTQNGDWRVGDIVHIDYTTQSQFEQSPRKVNPRTGEITYDEKCLHHVPKIDIDVYCEARYGIIIAIHYGDFGTCATVLPIFSYGGKGTIHKEVEFVIQHLPVVNRSEWADLKAKWEDQVQRGILRTVAGDSAVPLVPSDFTLIVDDDGAPSDFTPGLQKSSVVVSKSVTIRLDNRVGFIASLETASRNRLREFYLMYISMASVEKQELADFDRSKFPLSQFPWLEHMLPRSARSFSFTPPASQADQSNPFTAPPAAPPAAPTPATQPTDTPFADAQTSEGVDTNTAADEPSSRKRKDPPNSSLTTLEKAEQYLDDQKRKRDNADRQIQINERIITDAEVQIRAAGVMDEVNHRMNARRVIKTSQEAHRQAEQAIREAEERIVELEACTQETEPEEQVQESASKRRKFKDDDDEEIQSAVRIPSS